MVAWMWLVGSGRSLHQERPGGHAACGMVVSCCVCVVCGHYICGQVAQDGACRLSGVSERAQFTQDQRDSRAPVESVAV